jgi:hypothetical protein
VAYSTSLDFDAGSSDSGPWLRWHAGQTHDGSIAAGQWSVRDSDGVTVVNLTKPGLVLNWPVSKIGWMLTSGAQGVAPEKQWALDRSKLGRQPGRDWKKALHCEVAYARDARAVWEQSGVGAWSTFARIMATLREHNADQELPALPLLTFTGHDAVRVGMGATLIAKFSLVRFVPRPDCLTEEDDAEPAEPLRGAPTGSLFDDEIPF